MSITFAAQRPRKVLVYLLGIGAAVIGLVIVLEMIMWLFLSALLPGLCQFHGGTGMFCNPFLQRGIVTGIFIGIAGPLIGAYVVNRQMALIGEALAHTAFAGVAIGLFIGTIVDWANYPLLTAIVVAALAALGLQYLATHTDAYGDVPIAIMLTGSFALGLALISKGVGFGRTVNSWLFGNILMVPLENVRLMAGLAILVIGVVAITHKQLLFITFDREAARLARVNVRFYDTILIVLTALVVVAAMQIMGAILVAAMLVVPVAAAMQLADGFNRMVVLSVGIGVISVLFGIGLSYYWQIATGPMIVLTAVAIYLGSVVAAAYS